MFLLSKHVFVSKRPVMLVSVFQGGGAGSQLLKGLGELPAMGAAPVLANSRERVPTPRVSTTQIKMQDHRLD